MPSSLNPTSLSPLYNTWVRNGNLKKFVIYQCWHTLPLFNFLKFI